jgi:hypothetical protein
MPAPKIRLILAIDTDSYSGNFERELVSYVTGLTGEDQYHGEREAEDFREWAESEGLNPHMFEPIVEETKDSEYGWRLPIMLATPGRLNNGTGQHYDAAPDEKGWAAYESVGFALSRELTPEELAVIKSRAEQYGAANGIQIKGFRLITETSKTVSETVSL